MEAFTREKVWRCYRLHALGHGLAGPRGAAWQHGPGERACVVPVRRLSVSTLPKPAGGHLAGTASLSTRLWQWLLGQMEVQVALCLFKSPQLDCALSDSRQTIQAQVPRSRRQWFWVT